MIPSVITWRRIPTLHLKMNMVVNSYIPLMMNMEENTYDSFVYITRGDLPCLHNLLVDITTGEYPCTL